MNIQDDIVQLLVHTPRTTMQLQKELAPRGYDKSAVRHAMAALSALGKVRIVAGARRGAVYAAVHSCDPPVGFRQKQVEIEPEIFTGGIWTVARIDDEIVRLERRIATLKEYRALAELAEEAGVGVAEV